MKSFISNSRNCGPAPWRRAFSLIEIMIAVTLLTFILIGLLAMFFQVQRAFRAGTTQADILEGGRATMNLIVRDLQEMTAAQFPLVTNCAVLPSAGVNLTTQTLPSGSVRTNRMQDIVFLARHGDEWTAIRYDVAFSSNGVGVLKRFSTSQLRDTLPVRTGTLLADMTQKHRAFDSEFNVLTNAVLDGVVGLTFTPYYTNGVTYFDGVYTNHFGDNVRTIASGNWRYDFYGTGLPAYIDVELAVVEPNILARFRARDDDPAGRQSAIDYLNRQVGKTHLFRQRVALRAAASDIGAVR